MESIQIKGNGIYLPKIKLKNEQLAKKYNVTEEYIYQRTGIQTRYVVENETIEFMALQAATQAIKQANIEKQEIQMILVATTSTNQLMPGISYFVQKELDIKKCICMDILAGCSGYINIFDIARNYISSGIITHALIIGVDQLTHYIDKEDISTAIILSDGAGATIIGKSKESKIYSSYIQSEGQKGDILTCKTNEKIKMDGKQIYKYAVTQTVKNIEELLQENKKEMSEIKLIIPHQSNQKIIQGITNRLKVEPEKIYSNIQNVGNTFCASIPIALKEVIDNELVKPKDKLILLGYGGGLNTGSILLEF